jgi:hypothetical protein
VFDCPATVPVERAVAPDVAFTAAGFNYGGRHLRVALYWPRGVLLAGTLPDGGEMAHLNGDGSVHAKVGWWRDVDGELSIRGRRLDARAPPLTGDAPRAYSYPSGFIPSTITFPTTGCWRVTASVGRAMTSFVVRVRRVARAH